MENETAERGVGICILCLLGDYVHPLDSHLPSARCEAVWFFSAVYLSSPELSPNSKHPLYCALLLWV